MTDAPTPGQHKYLVKQAAYITRLRKQLMQEIGPAMQLSLKELRELVLQMDGQGLFRQMQWQQLEDLSSVPLERVSRAVQGVLRASMSEVVEDGAAAAASYISSAPPGAVNMPVDDILEQVMFDRSKYSVGKSLTPEKRDMISRYARKLQDDYAKTVRAGLIADEPTEVIANKVARVRVIRGREEALRRATTFANKVHAQVGNTIDGTIAQTLQIGERRAWKGVVKTQYVWVMDPALEDVHCDICWGLSAKEPQDSPSDFWKSPGWHPGCRCRILPVMSVEEGKVSERQRKELAERQRRDAERKKAQEEAIKRQAERKRKLAEQAAKKKAELAAKKKAEAAAKKRAEEAQKKAAAKAAAEKARIEKAKAEQAAKAKAAAEAKAKAVAEAKAKSKPAPVKKAKSTTVKVEKKADPQESIAKAEKKVAATDLSTQIAIKELEFKKLNQDVLLAQPKQIKAAAEKAKKAKAELEALKLKDPTYAAKQKAADQAWKKEIGKQDLDPELQDTDPPRKALKDYTGDTYREIRAEEFRAAKKAGKKLTPFEESQLDIFKPNKTYAKDATEIEAFLKRAPKYKGEVYRTMITDQQGLDDMLASFKSGKETFAMESWTADKNLDFAQGRGQRVLLRAKNKQGVNITTLSEFQKESEVLMPKGVKYKLKGVKKKEINARATKEGRYSWVIDLEQL